MVKSLENFQRFDKELKDAIRFAHALSLDLSRVHRKEDLPDVKKIVKIINNYHESCRYLQEELECMIMIANQVCETEITTNQAISSLDKIADDIKQTRKNFKLS